MTSNRHFRSVVIASERPLSSAGSACKPYSQAVSAAWMRAFGVARRMRQFDVQPHHLLVALLESGDTVCVDVILALGHDPACVRDRVMLTAPSGEFLVRSRPAVRRFGVRIPARGAHDYRLTFRCQLVDHLAQDEAAAADATSVNTGHMLLGLIREGTSLAADALRDLGVTTDSVRRMVWLSHLEDSRIEVPESATRPGRPRSRA